VVAVSDKPLSNILKTTMLDIGDSPEDHSKCFNPQNNPSNNYMVLNSRFVNIESFEIKLRPTVDFNKIIQFDLKSSAINWYFGSGGVLSRSLYRKAIVKTESVIW
ncbi:MAG TPA: hypothetical protein PLE51_03630, partial [Candidatus Pacearchaeota archaeon]|nr:hypothetical protein [Candidatus Pacearchaeota archaeon]